MTGLAVIGNLARVVVAGGDPRPGGGVFWSTRALSRLGAEAVVTAACSAEDRPALVPALEAPVVPVSPDQLPAMASAGTVYTSFGS